MTAVRATCTHVALLCRDIEASVAFYREHVGLDEVHRRVDGGTVVVWLGEKERKEDFVLVLIDADHADAVEPAPLAHLGYAVASREDVDRAYAQAERAGLTAQAPVYAGPIVGYYCLVRDPDGNWVEFSYGQSLGSPAATS